MMLPPDDEGPSEIQLKALKIVDQQARKFLSRAARIVNCRQAAHDVLQELRVQILASNTLPTEDERLTRYLFGMLVRTAVKWRTKNFDPRIEHCGSPDTDLGRIQEQLWQHAGAEADYGPVDVDFRNAFLKRLAGDLPRKCAKRFLNVLKRRVTGADVAPTSSTTSATEKSHYQRALKKLRLKIQSGDNS